MSVPTLGDLDNVAGARVLLRLDLNVPLADGVVQDTTRIDAALPTVRWLLERSAVVAACSHLGKPKGVRSAEKSLAPVASVLERELGTPVVFVSDCVGTAVSEAVNTAPPGSLVLLENLRFHAGEQANDAEFARALAEPFGMYVNDAFGTAHRAHASVAGVPALFASGRKAAGRLMQMELDALVCLMQRTERPFVAVVGGAKISTKTRPLEALLERVDQLTIGGGMANTFLLAQGLEVGDSLVEEAMLDTARRVLEGAANRGVELLLPTDLVVTDSIAEPRDTRVVAADAVPADAAIADIGPATRDRFAAVVSRARTVFWNGPMGVFESAPFAQGTLAVANALAQCTGFTVVGGGESVMAVHRAGVADRLSHVSTGGGASLSLVAGDALPAVVALEA